MGQALKLAFNGRRKVLLTAMPLQNSLMELYSLSMLLDEYLFGDEKKPSVSSFFMAKAALWIEATIGWFGKTTITEHLFTIRWIVK